MSQISPNTRLTMTAVAWLTLIGGVMGFTYHATNLLRDVRDDIRGIRQSLAEINHRKVGYDELERWTYSLERDNRSVPLRVPDLRSYQPAGKTKPEQP